MEKGLAFSVMYLLRRWSCITPTLLLRHSSCAVGRVALPVLAPVNTKRAPGLSTGKAFEKVK